MFPDVFHERIESGGICPRNAFKSLFYMDYQGVALNFAYGERNHFAVKREFTADKSEFVETLGKFDGVAEFVVFL